MDATRGSNRRLIAKVATFAAPALIGVLVVGATGRANAQTHSVAASGPAKPSSTASEPRIPTTVRILTGPGEPASTPALRILGAPPEPAPLEQPRATLGDLVGQVHSLLPITEPPLPTTLLQPSGVRWAVASQSTAASPADDGAPTPAPSGVPLPDGPRLVVAQTETPSVDATGDPLPAIPQPLWQPQPGLPPESERFPPESELPPGIEYRLLGRPTTSPRLDDAGLAVQQDAAPLGDRYALTLAATEPSSTEDREDDNRAASSEEEAPEKLGEAPKETKTELQFLRRESVLLDPGQYQIDVTCEYLIDESDYALAEIDEEVLRIGEALHRQRLLLVPLEFRLGVCQDTQAFVNVPFGWSNSEFSFSGRDEYANAGGIGDVSAGITRVLLERDEVFPDVLGTLAFSAPTGKASAITSLSTPGSSLGEGFWTLTMDLTFIHTYDPVVIFYGFGYRHRFPNEFEGGIRVNPGKQALYRVGLGFAVNPRVTLSAAFLGSYIGDDRVNDVRIAGSIREPMYLRFAATIVRDPDSCRSGGSPRTVEPFVRMGMTDESVDALVGVSWTR